MLNKGPSADLMFAVFELSEYFDHSNILKKNAIYLSIICNFKKRFAVFSEGSLF